jgi:DinB family protein
MTNLERQPIGNLLLRGLHRGYAELVNEVGVADRREPARIDSETGWSLRGHLAHLAAWEAIELARAEGRSGLPEHLDMLAEVAFRRRRGGPLAEAMERFTAVHRRLVAVLTDLPETTLRRPWSAAYPDSLAANIARNTYQHYAEHLPAVRRLAASHPEPSVRTAARGSRQRGPSL